MRHALLVACFFILSVAHGDGLPASPPDGPPAQGRPLVDITPSEAYQEQVFAESELMTGGKRIIDPLRRGVTYYLAPASLLWQGQKNPINYGKQSGLFLSKDGGKTWQVLSRKFEYKHLFVHPLTGEFFAIIDYQWLETQKDGYLAHCSADKIVRSTDGKNWVDITHGPGYVADLVSIFQDPDHPNRICVGACLVRYIVYQYTDDNYSDWKGIRGDTWYKAHPQTQRSGAENEPRGNKSLITGTR